VKYIILALLFSTQVFAKGLCDWPDPGYKIHERSFTGIDQAAYSKVLDQVQAKYDPIFQRLGFSLKLHRSWTDGTINAQAWWTGPTCNVEMFGGLARYPGITAAGYRLVALHEIGHCLGGDPFYPGDNMSCEGQADYYSTLVGCRSLGIGCKAAGLNLSRALASMSGESRPYRPGPPLNSVSRTYCDHPEAQCRLNTYDAGSSKIARPGCWFKP
jgi:hypothetical protein